LSAGEIRFRRLDPAAVIPAAAHDGDAGLDLTAISEHVVGPGGRVSVSTGLAVEIPLGHAGLVLPRSGLAAKHGIGLSNAPGLIDAGYRGEIQVLLLNAGAVEFRVEAGMRVAQLVIVAFAALEPVEVPALSDSVRGVGGFGSTG
jgi:dUTP pyrophosphatase